MATQARAWAQGPAPLDQAQGLGPMVQGPAPLDRAWDHWFLQLAAYSIEVTPTP